MKSLNLLLTAILFLCLAGISNGQSSKLETGFEGGPGIARIWGNDFADQQLQHAWVPSAGLFFQMNMNSWFSVRSGLSYERKGAARFGKLTDAQGNDLGTYANYGNFDYLTLPLLARLNFGKRIQYFVHVGPYFSYLLKQTDVMKRDNAPTQKYDGTNSFRRFDTGISTGLGLSIPFKTSFAFNLEVRNNLGLYPINKGPVYNGGTIQHHSAQLLFGLGYRFGDL